MRVRSYHVLAEPRVAQTVGIHYFCGVTLQQVGHFCASLINSHAHILAAQLRAAGVESGEQVIPVEWRSVKILVHVHKRS